MKIVNIIKPVYYYTIRIFDSCRNNYCTKKTIFSVNDYNIFELLEDGSVYNYLILNIDIYVSLRVSFHILRFITVSVESRVDGGQWDSVSELYWVAGWMQFEKISLDLSRRLI